MAGVPGWQPRCRAAAALEWHWRFGAARSGVWSSPPTCPNGLTCEQTPFHGSLTGQARQDAGRAGQGLCSELPGRAREPGPPACAPPPLKGETVELSRALKVVRGLLAKAESLEQLGDAHSLHEAQACRERADQIMQEHGAQEWRTMQAADKSFKPDRIKIDIGEAGSQFLTETATLCNVVADFCGCKSVWMEGSGYGQRQEYCWVYGYESDLRYFELLFTTLLLHMTGAIFPKPDLTKSLEENAYALRSAGL